MYSNLRSLIFKIDPERAHFLAIQSLKLNLVSNIFDENKNDPILKTKLFNQNLDNPIGLQQVSIRMRRYTTLYLSWVLDLLK